jgi:hypothetical protein
MWNDDKGNSPNKKGKSDAEDFYVFIHDEEERAQ